MDARLAAGTLAWSPKQCSCGCLEHVRLKVGPHYVSGTFVWWFCVTPSGFNGFEILMVLKISGPSEFSKHSKVVLGSFDGLGNFRARKTFKTCKTWFLKFWWFWKFLAPPNILNYQHMQNLVLNVLMVWDVSAPAKFSKPSKHCFVGFEGLKHSKHGLGGVDGFEHFWTFQIFKTPQNWFGMFWCFCKFLDLPNFQNKVLQVSGWFLKVSGPSKPSKHSKHCFGCFDGFENFWPFQIFKTCKT